MGAPQGLSPWANQKREPKKKVGNHANLRLQAREWTWATSGFGVTTLQFKKFEIPCLSRSMPWGANSWGQLWHEGPTQLAPFGIRAPRAFGARGKCDARHISSHNLNVTCFSQMLFMPHMCVTLWETWPFIPYNPHGKPNFGNLFTSTQVGNSGFWNLGFRFALFENVFPCPPGPPDVQLHTLMFGRCWGGVPWHKLNPLAVAGAASP